MYLQAASGAILCDDAHVRGVNAAADETGQVFILNVSHLEGKEAAGSNPTKTISIPQTHGTESRTRLELVGGPATAGPDQRSFVQVGGFIGSKRSWKFSQMGVRQRIDELAFWLVGGSVSW